MSNNDPKICNCDNILWVTKELKNEVYSNTHNIKVTDDTILKLLGIITELSQCVRNNFFLIQKLLREKDDFEAKLLKLEKDCDLLFLMESDLKLYIQNNTIPSY
jgi:hypothetical protein